MPIEDYAILNDLGVTQEQVDTYFENKVQPPTPPALPEITKQKAVAVANAMFVEGIEKSGGVISIARSTGLRPSQVKEIMAALEALYAEWVGVKE
jgi:hypothetical protein